MHQPGRAFFRPIQNNNNKFKKKKKNKKKQKIIATLDKYFPCGLFEKKSSSWLGAILMGRHIPRLKEWAQAFNF